ncbi:hypothetical protein BC831DRAFT_452003 [Entophlyctis helioformis]|nr:hypothetical protein BC831DRAFT_452003 [Entophlyctis helioformis]
MRDVPRTSRAVHCSNRWVGFKCRNCLVASVCVCVCAKGWCVLVGGIRVAYAAVILLALKSMLSSSSNSSIMSRQRDSEPPAVSIDALASNEPLRPVRPPVLAAAENEPERGLDGVAFCVWCCECCCCCCCCCCFSCCCWASLWASVTMRSVRG